MGDTAGTFVSGYNDHAIAFHRSFDVRDTWEMRFSKAKNQTSDITSLIIIGWRSYSQRVASTSRDGMKV